MVFSVGGSQIYHLDIIYDISYRVLERTLDKTVTNITMNIIIKNRLYMYICIQWFGREWHFKTKMENMRNLIWKRKKAMTNDNDSAFATKLRWSPLEIKPNFKILYTCKGFEKQITWFYVYNQILRREHGLRRLWFVIYLISGLEMIVISFIIVAWVGCFFFKFYTFFVP